jgi:peptide/nickel transport system permease protein
MSSVAGSDPDRLPNLRRPDEALLASGLRRFWRRRSNQAGAVVLVLGFLVACIPTGVLPFSPIGITVQDRLLAPRWAWGSAGHLLGTDNLGRDIACRVIFAARFSLSVTMVSASLASLVGVTAGMAAGYWGG